jgi:hypothetical protein
MARAAVKQEKIVDMNLVAKAIAKAVADGDIVNFKSLFGAISPIRQWTSEELETDKYSFFRPTTEQENTQLFKDAHRLVKEMFTWKFIQQELDAKRPAQLPSELLIPLADNAVRASKFSSAAQAYELLRMRRKMQAEFFEAADKAIAANDIPRAVQGYRVATGLAYDYAAFPEPLPKVANYQNSALLIHGRYPRSVEECVSLQPAESHVNIAIGYLLGDDEASGRLSQLPLEKRLEFLKALVERIDPAWEEFVTRFKAACALVLKFAERLQHQNATLADEINEQQGHNPSELMETMLGRTIEDGEWWQYLKDLAYEHPASILFIARQRIGDNEVLMPRLLSGSTVVEILGLAQEEPAQA